MGIYEKLMIIQQDLIAPKNQYNSFGKYNYRSCEDILEGLKPCLKKVKAVVTISDEIIEISGRHYVRSTAYLHDTESDAYVQNSAYAREEESKKGMDASQVTGSASSYARKYALNGLFCIDDVKDADTRDNRQKDAEQQKSFEDTERRIASQLISSTKVKALRKLFIENGIAETKVLSLYKVNSLEEFTEAKYSNTVNNIDKIKSQCGA